MALVDVLYGEVAIARGALPVLGGDGSRGGFRDAWRLCGAF